MSMRPSGSLSSSCDMTSSPMLSSRCSAAARQRARQHAGRQAVGADHDRAPRGSGSLPDVQPESLGPGEQILDLTVETLTAFGQTANRSPPTLEQQPHLTFQRLDVNADGRLTDSQSVAAASCLPDGLDAIRASNDVGCINR
jgi:hypothetical protein